MLTINYKGKTYKPTDAWHFSVQAIVNDLIEKDCLEEVKENKETLYGRSIEEQIREHLATPSILEKLREMKKDMLYERKREDLDSYESGQLKVIEDLLASLDTPQFTPGQEIECSHTGKEWDWFKEKFTKMVGVNKDLYGVEGEESWYRFARPIEDKIDHDQVKENIRVMDEQDGYKIEPELPDYKANRIAPDGRHTLAHPNKLEIQVEDLNTFCQALARQKPTK